VAKGDIETSRTSTLRVKHMSDRLTHGSVWALIRDVAAFAKHLAEQGGHPQTIREAIAGLSMAGLSSVVWQAPGLSCEIRSSLLPLPSILLLTFRQTPTAIEAELTQLTQAIPALEPPLREQYPDEAAWHEACKVHTQAWRAWVSAHPDGPVDAYHNACERRKRLQATLEEQHYAGNTFTIEVGLKGRTERLPARYMKAFRQVETWRFKPGQESPLDKAVQKAQKTIANLKRQGKRAEVEASEAALQRLSARMEIWPPVKRRRQARGAWGWKPLWIDPQGTTPLDDIQFVVVLYSSQERLLDLDLTPDVSTFLKNYMGQFKYAVPKEERDLLPKHFRLAHGGSGFSHLTQTYAAPEDWRALRRYIAKTLYGRQVSAARKEARTSQHQSSLSPEEAETAQQLKRYGKPRKPQRPILVPTDAQGQRLYAVHEIVQILEAEAAEDMWVPSVDTLYDWGNAGLFIWHRDERKRKSLDEDGLNKVRARVEGERTHQKLVKRAEAVGMSRWAVKKASQRGRLEAIIARREAERQRELGDRATLEEARAELEWQLSQAITEDERLEIIDKQRQLDRMHESWGRAT
jgi:hypothetical protein